VKVAEVEGRKKLHFSTFVVGEQEKVLSWSSLGEGSARLQAKRFPAS
jgi:hypothetical protein